MENGSNRTLAYTLARTISDEDLSDVSGGFQTSVKHSNFLTGSSLTNFDVSHDIKMDI